MTPEQRDDRKVPLLASFGKDELALYHRLIPLIRWLTTGVCLISLLSQSLV